MTSTDTNNSRPRGSWIKFLLLPFALLLLSAVPALADDCVADRGGLIDGFVNPVPPSQINIDGNCTIRNFPASNPLTSNISFFTSPGQNKQRWLIIFDNVVHTGQMSCNSVLGHHIWFTNGSSSGIHQNCQNLLIPVEKINKQNPSGQTTASIGVPFAYRLTIPVLWDPATGTVINTSGSVNTLHGITITDDLNATGASLTYVSHTINWVDDGTPVPHSFSNAAGVLTFANFPIVASGRQFVIALTVVLNDTPANAPGTQFINTAKWEFGRLIDGTFYQPLPGEWGITPPMTIAAPLLTATKSGPATMNVGQWGNFAINVQNIGFGDAWNAGIRDVLPNGPTGGMCSLTPEILSAQVFAADGVTPVAGKGPLSQGSGYSLSYSAAPNCQLDITVLSAAGRIGPNERLIVRYRTQLDSNTQNGVALTNIAGAVQWFNGDSSNTNRIVSTRTLTNGTPGVLDHEDAHTVTVALSGYFFDKTVVNLTTGANPAVTAAPGDTLRYTLSFRATNPALNDFRIFDEPDALNAQAAFVAGSLTLFSYPAGADISGTNSTGGAKGTGVIDIRNLNLPLNGTAQIQYDITLKPVLGNGTIVTNQSTARNSADTIVAVSDNPNVNGTADPAVAGDEDPTRVTIVAAPSFRVQKISTDLTGDPNTLVASDTLRYTITVKNVGNADATNVLMRDAVPANTTYVAGSTTLNGVAVADVAGLSPLVNSMPINSPANAISGSMPADATSNPANVATIVFDVVVNSNVVNGMVISNQAFVTAVSSGLVDVPSDDPDTPIANDPTRDIAGNLPLLYAEKKVALFNDLGSPGVVDPGDVLRYTITVQNSASISATNAFLKDAVPANLTYVANSTLLNGLPVGQPDGGVSVLAAGINISSSNLTPPLPGPGAGTLSPGSTAILQYDMLVNAGTPAGTLIRNQAVVTTAEAPTLLTDGDGNAATGPEPTVVVVGVGQQLSISNQVTVVGGGPALPGAQLEYVIRVTNITSVPAVNVVITDNLDASQPGQLAYVSGSSTMNGSSSGVSFTGSTITADFSSVIGQLAPGGVVVLRFRATLNANLALNTVVPNTAVVVWNNPIQTAVAGVSIVVGSVPGFAVLNGLVWHDSNFNDVRDSGERGMAGWSVDLYRDGALWQTVLTDASGVYRILGVDPNDVTGVRYELRFRAPGAGANTAMLGRGISPFTNGLQRISDIIASSGTNLQGLNLSIHPNGVVYSSMARIPIAGATLTLLDAVNSSPLPASCFDDAAQQGQITLADGYYKFDLNFSGPACPSGGNYLIGVAPPQGTSFVAGLSQIIPPVSSASTAAFSVPACPGSSADAVPGTAQFCEVQPSEFAPGASITPRTAGTNYYIHLMLDSSQTPGSSQIFNNHIPLDPQLAGSIMITKTTPLLNVTRGQQVPYVITVNNVAGQLLTDVGIVDRLPVGFTYVRGSALLDGVQTEPTVLGRTLNWSGLVIVGTQIHTVKLLLAAGGGVTEGEFVNRAQAVSGVTSNAMSGEATATVRIVPDPTFDCTDVTGKVFNDANRNGRQDGSEIGLPGVRVVTTGGLWATTDQYGRYHITCAITPNEDRGSNFALKLDDRTLPSGFRLSTDQLQIQRATRGKMLQLNFGASIHRVVGIDLSDAVFVPGTTEFREQWRPRIDLLLEQLHKEPAVLRLSYVADIEDAALVERRMEAVKRQLTKSWGSTKSSYVLTIEHEVFWRRGAPPKRPDMRVQGSK